MKVTAIKCPKCDDTVYSRARHDMRFCRCGAVSIDGGQDGYIRISGTSEIIKIDVDVTKAQLYQDWNKRIDKHGLIKSKKEF